jgi:hypothetical protein
MQKSLMKDASCKGWYKMYLPGVLGWIFVGGHRSVSTVDIPGNHKNRLQVTVNNSPLLYLSTHICCSYHNIPYR